MSVPDLTASGKHAGPQPATLVVMESTPGIRPTTNPYITQLIAALQAEPSVEVKLFSFREAIFGRYDVFHVHWPEAMLAANSALKRWRRRVLTFLFLQRIRVSRKALVRTWHNLELPQGLSRVDRYLIGLADRITTFRIALNPLSTFPDDRPSEIIPHGHYRDWYATQQRYPSVPGRVTFVGLIRRYKGVENLVSAFHKVDRPGLSLHVSGRPSTEELRTALADLANGDPRITLRFEFLDDADFVREITESSLVVLPYLHMHNSGTVLAALSLDRPVLAPDTPMNRMLAGEVGPGWIHYFDGELSTAELEAALAALAENPPAGRPNLDAREWLEAGTAHAEAFRRAFELAHRFRRREGDSPRRHR